MRENNLVFIIDAQKDFCDRKIGSLFVKGADEDVSRMSKFIRDNSDKIGRIILTLDTHSVKDISHPSWWRTSDGKNVEPFTTITLEDIDSGKYIANVDPSYSRSYVAKLEESNEFEHFIWPEHCIIGSEGHNIVPELLEAVNEWERSDLSNAEGALFVNKGEDPYAEYFGAFQPQVSATVESMNENTNFDLLNQLKKADSIAILGEALSHCVAKSIQQILDLAPELAPNLIVITDCMSNVAGFEGQADNILERARTMGAKFRLSTDKVW